jgi:hypothetical protein
LASVLGLSFTSESITARRTIGGSNKGRARLPRERPIAVESAFRGAIAFSVSGS